MKNNNLSISQIISNILKSTIIGYFIAVVLAVVALAIQGRYISTLNSTYLQMQEDIAAAKTDLVTGESALYKMNIDKSSLKKFNDLMESCDKSYEKHMKKISGYTNKFEKELAQLEKLNAELEENEEVSKTAIFKSDPQANRIVAEKFLPVMEKMNTILSKMLEESQSMAKSYVLKSQISLVITIILVFAFLIVTTLRVRKKTRKDVESICTPIEEMKNAMIEISQGNLDVEIQYEGNNEIGSLSHAMRETITELKLYIENIGFVLENLSNKNYDISVEMEYQGAFKGIKHSLDNIIGSLNGVMTEIRKSMEKIEQSTSEITKASENLADGTTEQSSVIEELFATVTNVVEQVQQSNQIVADVTETSIRAKEDVESNNEKMQQVQNAMQEIQEATSKIGSILGEIRSIASKTNLLALNASIEAARAGEAGRGFDVVAGQIGNLSSEELTWEEDVNITVSVGVSHLEINEKGVAIADQRLYQAKENGKNQVVWEG